MWFKMIKFVVCLQNIYMKINHLKHKNINFSDWDDVVLNSKNSFIYAQSWLLDCIAPDWEALVSDDFEFVMPLPIKKKIGIKYVFKPFIAQQLGVFSKKKITEHIVNEFVKAIPYCSYEMALNEQNYISNALTKPNFVLPLNDYYEEIVKKFGSNTIRNIQKAEKKSLIIEWNLNKASFIRFFFGERKIDNFWESDVIKKLINVAAEKKSMQLIGVKSAEGEVIAALGLLISDSRLIYLLPVSSKEGKEKLAMFLLINEIIKRYCGSGRILDFEGSIIEGIARFYKGFGGEKRDYYVVKRLKPKFGK